MVVTATRLTKGSAVCAITAGLLFILVQLIHPTEDAASVASSSWAVTHGLTLAMAVLALIGVTGMYLQQAQRAGLLGLTGYGLFAVCFLIIACYTFVEAFVLPTLTDTVPQYVNDVVALPAGGTVLGNVGALQAVVLVSALTYLFGGLVFGLSSFKARVLSRPAALLLIAGTVSTVLVPALPHAAARLTAVPVGLALAWLGASLWAAAPARELPAPRGGARQPPVQCGCTSI